jgi:hypothetical protein
MERKDYHREWRAKNRGEYNAKQRKYYEAHKEKYKESKKRYAQTEQGKKNRAAARKRWRLANLEKVSAYHRALGQRQRKKVIEHYGGRCACCAEATYEFLAIDHKDGGGAGDRKRGLVARRWYSWIIRNGFPTSLQILCHNCNVAKGIYGECPHKR